MAIDHVMDELQRAGVLLVPDGDRLRAKPASAINDELRALIRDHKPDLLAAISIPADVESRLVRMVKSGAIDSDDADLARARFHLYPEE